MKKERTDALAFTAERGRERNKQKKRWREGSSKDGTKPNSLK